MRKFEELNQEEKQEAVEQCMTELVELIIEGSVRFDDRINKSDTQAKIDDALARSKQAPWKAKDFILDVARRQIFALAIEDAQSALYPGPGEWVIYLKGTKKKE